jgi:bis(5'-nucleosidyl)-tetraphosphatase
MDEAAGYIVFHDAGDGRRYLLLRNRRHGTWGFPKGHLESGEDHAAAARRELLEETGIAEIEPISDFESQTTYVPKGRPDDDADDAPKKRVVYFLGKAPTPAFRRSDEHDAGGWMTAEEATATLQFEDLRRVFREALRRLKAP